MTDSHAITPAAIHPLIAAMQLRDQTPETLRAMLDLQRDWEAGEAKKAFSTALIALKRDLPAVLSRDQTVDYTGAKGRVHYTHTSLAAAVAAVTPHLITHGFAVHFAPTTAGSTVTVACVLSHAGGHSERCEISAPADGSGGKSPAQGVASTITLLSRYALLGLLGIATADMADPRPAASGDTLVRCVAHLRRLGRLADAESHIGSPHTSWGAEQIEEVRSWLTK